MDPEKARKRAYAAQRPEYAKWYTKPRWRRLRAEHLAGTPFCVVCRAKATEVDHKIPHKGNPGLFFGKHNLQSMCHRCHSSKTARESKFAKDGKDRLLGMCDDDGLPTHADHPWNLWKKFWQKIFIWFEKESFLSGALYWFSAVDKLSTACITCQKPVDNFDLSGYHSNLYNFCTGCE